jgi:MFS-type transporter involved in bile tolerance (Atg22 family)
LLFDFFFFAMIFPLFHFWFATKNSNRPYYTENCCYLNGLFIIFDINAFFKDICYDSAH